MFKPTVTLRTLRQKQLPSFEIWLTLDGIFSNCSKGRSVGNVEFGSLRAFKILCVQINLGFQPGFDQKGGGDE